MKLFVTLVVLALVFVWVDGRRHGLDKYEEEQEDEELYERGIGEQSELHKNDHQNLHAHVKRKFVSLTKTSKPKHKKRGKIDLQNLAADDEEANMTDEDNDALKERRKQHTNIKRKFVKANTGNKKSNKLSKQRGSESNMYDLKRRELIRLLKKWLQVKEN